MERHVRVRHIFPPRAHSAANGGALLGILALKTLDDRLLAWRMVDDKRGFSHRLGGAWLHPARSTITSVYMALALLDAYEATLES